LTSTTVAATIVSVMTSSSLPSNFPITPIQVGTGGGVIGMAYCPGRSLVGVPSPEWDRDLTADLDALREFGASALISLMEADELDQYGAPPATLEAEVPARAITWYHLPIIDMSIPTEAFEASWKTAGLEIRALLGDGESVVVHCLGGLGRTGMITARLLVEFGVDPEEAIRTVRAARSGAIQTVGQEHHVRSCQRTDDACG